MNDASYWMKKLVDDNARLDESRKTNLVKELLTYVARVTPDEAEAFLQAPRLMRSDEVLKYAVLEKKVADAFAGASPTDSDVAGFSLRFGEILSGFYTGEELADLTRYFLSENDATLAVFQLVGYTHPHIRRIRNAYLPEITDILVIDHVTGRGEEITGSLFDGPDDAVTQIGRLLGKRPYNQQ